MHEVGQFDVLLLSGVSCILPSRHVNVLSDRPLLCVIRGGLYAFSYGAGTAGGGCDL
jgi:hypothetical protein